MKMMTFTVPLVLVLMFASSIWGDQLVKKPGVDEKGRFNVYTEMEDPMPFIPHGWMPEEAAQMIQVFDTGHQDSPHDGETCLAVTIEWGFPWWCGVAWMTGERDIQGQPWWGQDDSAPVYDLTDAERLVFFLKGKSGKERLQVQLGILWDKEFGDVIEENGVRRQNPIMSEWITLTKEWEEYSIDLTGFDLLRIANGFTFVSSRLQQIDETAPVIFFIDDVYYSYEPEPHALADLKSNTVTAWGRIKQGF